MAGRDPDDAFSQVAYVKGQLLLQLLENRFGRAKFDTFISHYFQTFAFQSMDTQTFLHFLQRELLDKYPGVVGMAEVEQWVFGPGLPEGFPMQHSYAFEKVVSLQQSWLNQQITLSDLPVNRWTVHEWLHFINQLPRDLAPAKLAELDTAFALSQSRNAEIFVAWSRLTIPQNYLPVMPQVKQFLLQVGRTKFVVPLYRLLLANPAQYAFAGQIYQQAKAGYHPLTQAQIDKAFAG